MQHTVVALFLLASLLFSVVFCGVPDADDYNAVLQRKLYDDLRRMQPSSWASRGLAKRAPHQIEARALNQFKNCYFSPIQCVLMERRR